jgi:hypothetical protein
MDASEPIKIRLCDGTELELLLTLGGLRRAMRRLGVTSLKEAWDKYGEMTILSLLYDALPAAAREKYGEDEFADLLPANLAQIAEVVHRLLGGKDTPPFAWRQATEQSSG